MGRRHHILAAISLAVAGPCLATVSAAPWQDDPIASRSVGKSGTTADPAPADPAQPGELPADFPSKTQPGSNLGPEPTPYHTAESPAPNGQKPLTQPRRASGKKASPAPKPAPDANGELPPPAETLPPPLTLSEPPPMGAPAPVAAPAAAAAQSEEDPFKTLDASVEKAQAVVGTPIPQGRRAAPGGGTGDPAQLPPAIDRPGQPIANGVQGKEPETPYVVAPEKLPVGRQGIGLTVEVIGPQFLNLNQTAALKVVVKNTGTTDARGVVVRDNLPPNLTFVSSQPEATRVDSVLTWHLGDVPAGSERVVSLSVKPTGTGSFDHAATVTMAAGARARTTVREPKIKVEQSANTSKVLRGQPVSFKIAITNPGDGPARNVTVQAKLSPGLRHESGEPNEQNLFEQTIDLIGPGETFTLDTLVADTVAGGEQSCVVVASSPDVVAGSPEAKSVQVVNVVEPKLNLKVSGPKDRYTDTIAAYEIVLENPGTAAAKNVRVVATLPVSGKLQTLPPGARFDPQTRKLTWARPQLDAGEKAVLTFQVRVGGVGLYPVAAEGRADTVPLSKDVFQTDVTGLADVTFNVSEKRRVVDVDGTTTFVIRVSNTGTKEATRLLISAMLSGNVVPTETLIPGSEEVAQHNATENKVVFPPIPRLGPGKSMEMGIRVKATKPGIATCRVFLTHDELPEKLDDVAAFKVMPTRR